MKSKNTTQGDITRWIELNRYMSLEQIAEAENRNRETIRRQFVKIKYKWDIHQKSKKFNRREIENIHKEYIESDANLQEIADKYNISWQRLKINLSNYNLITKSHEEVSKNKNIDHYFFNEIDTEIKAYLLGFFAADGHVRKNGNSYSMIVKIHESDVEILQLYNNYIANNTLIIRKSVDNKIISIHSKSIGEALYQKGYTNRKTYDMLTIPDLSAEMTRHFIRGYFDGDGYIGGKEKKNRIVVIVCKNKSVLEKIASKLPLLLEEIKYREVGSSWQLYIIRHIAIKKMYNYMYNESTYYLERKKNKFDNVIKTLKV